jgi:non-canonical poly(A) RNA polymerase PAPD5/7
VHYLTHETQQKSFGNPERLTIEDPNNTGNDISGGARAIDLILHTFANAHTTLKNRMEHLALVRGPNKSILGPIIAADFGKYTEQRSQLRRVFMTENRFAGHRVPSPLPLELYHESGVHSAPPLVPAGPPPIRLPVRPVQNPINNAKSRSKGMRAEPEDISDEYASETKLVKPRKGQVGRQARRWRAA